MVAPGGLQMRREDGRSHAGALGGRKELSETSERGSGR